jgi:cytochrome c
MKQLARLIALGILALAATSAFAVPRGTPGQAKAMFDQAVALMQKEGPDKAFAAFNDPHGKFVRGDLYVFVFDMGGKYMASGANPSMVGTAVEDMTDAAGNPVVKNIIETAKTKGEGTVSYVWLDRATNSVENKTSYIKRVGDYVVGVGYYTPRADAQRAKRFFDHAVAYMQKVGPDKAFAAFDDANGEFVKGDLYVFVFDMDGKYMASGANPSMVGTAVRDMTDAAGNPVVKNLIEAATTKGEGTVDYVWRNPVTNKVEKKRSYVKKVGNYVLGVGYYTN